jgi:hypothetical protein
VQIGNHVLHAFSSKDQDGADFLRELPSSVRGFALLSRLDIGASGAANDGLIEVSDFRFDRVASYTGMR